MKELDFDEVMKDYSGMMNTLTFANIEYNLEKGNYTLDDAKALFPSYSDIIDKIYNRDYRENYQ